MHTVSARCLVEAKYSLKRNSANMRILQEILYGFVQGKADEYMKSEAEARYQAAAQDLGMPYWDWTFEPQDGQDYFPVSLSTKQIKIVQPGSNGKTLHFKNPLFAFTFPGKYNPADGIEDQGSKDKWVRLYCSLTLRSALCVIC